ncbi:DUF3850 domain-containing protein [Methylomonas rosea]|uniref:DUF3850 domain-containing protein n=1 Tax=Methylomonas rosea TaxID=2952227 RepID=A0ABT1TMV7_9GAMM|nr:DUF3850 domain-containing protein [Methylomonas sp. WSC-7]MCQ8116109.1 DUF3850 domain-containing protein [Methylomonas sp. WSC-7]
MIHHLKTYPAFFEATARHEKLFEIRNNRDRGFQRGDTVILHECDQISGIATGREIMAKITYVLNFAQKSDYVVFGMSIIDPTFDL